MKVALFLGCTIPTEQYAYEISVREVLPKFGVEMVDLKDANCCGYPVFRGVNPLAWIYLSARDLALSERQGLDLLAICNGCNLSLSEAKHHLEKDPDLKNRINELLEREGLEYTGKTKVYHTLDILYDMVGVEKIRSFVKKPLSGLKLAAHYGCHIIRPSDFERPDNPEDPHKLEDLLKALGAESPDYPERLDCCGSSLAIVQGGATLSIAGEKLRAISDYGYDGMVVICPFCMKIFDTRQRAIGVRLSARSITVPVLYYTQLLGLSMGLSSSALGLGLNVTPMNSILNKLGG